MIAVVDYGIGNLYSAFKALATLSSDVNLVDDPASLEDADAIVVPGVGDFGACVGAFRTRGFEDPLRQAIGRGIPILGICVGLQMLYEGSEESPSVDGLGVLKGVVRKLRFAPRLPHMQWSALEGLDDPRRRSAHGLFDGIEPGSWVYFVHSYGAELSEVTTSHVEYGVSFSASVQLGSVYGTQFHPEKSSRVGLAILGNFVRIAEEASR